MPLPLNADANRGRIRNEVKMEKQPTSRIQWIDLAKGLAMLMIILGHAGIDVADRFLYPFHVPVFLLISGYFITPKTSYSAFALKRVRTLLIPYVFNVLLVVLTAGILAWAQGNSTQTLPLMGEWGLRGLYGSGSAWVKTFGGIKHIGPPWFLWALF